MTKSELSEKVREIDDTVYRLYRQIREQQHDDRDIQIAANLLYNVSDILDVVYGLISE